MADYPAWMRLLFGLGAGLVMVSPILAFMLFILSIRKVIDGNEKSEQQPSAEVISPSGTKLRKQ